MIKRIRNWLGRKSVVSCEVELTINRPEVGRIGLASVYFVYDRKTKQMLTTIEGSIFFASAEEAQAVIDNGSWLVKVGGLDTAMQWRYYPDTNMVTNGDERGMGFYLHTPGSDRSRRYGFIYVSLKGDLHAKIGIVSGHSHAADDKAWMEDGRLVLAKDLFDELTKLFEEITAEERLIEVSAQHYIS